MSAKREESVCAIRACGAHCRRAACAPSVLNLPSFGGYSLPRFGILDFTVLTIAGLEPDRYRMLYCPDLVCWRIVSVEILSPQTL